MFCQYFFVAVLFMMSAVFFVFDRVTTKKCKVLYQKSLKEIHSGKILGCKAGFFLPIYIRWMVLNLFLLSVACASGVLGLFFLLRLIAPN
jgi:hypothetical protein